MKPVSNSLSSMTVAPNGVAWLTVPGWQSVGWLWNGFSTRIGGSSTVYAVDSQAQELNLGMTAHDTAENVRENRQRFVEAVTGSRETPLATLRQVHSKISVTIARGEAADFTVTREADGMMTDQGGILLGVQTADCIPVLLVDPAKKAVGAFHAGWRGTVERIVELGVSRMQNEFGSDPADLMAAIGAGIGSCCYTVGEEVRTRFEANFSYAEALFTSGAGKARLDLTEANRRQLLAAGLRPESVAIVGGCTSCQPELFFSHRAAGGRAGRMMAVIGIRSF